MPSDSDTSDTDTDVSPSAPMIRTFANATTAALFAGHHVHTLPTGIQITALRRLDVLDAAASLPDLLATPAIRVEANAGRQRIRWQIGIEASWHICFHFLNGNAWDVEIVDQVDHVDRAAENEPADAEEPSRESVDATADANAGARP